MLKMVKDKLDSMMPMKGCAPMFYPEAIHNLYVWTANASRECQRDHNWHGEDKVADTASITKRNKELAEGHDRVNL